MKKMIDGVRAALEQMAEAKTAEGNKFTKELMAARKMVMLLLLLLAENIK